MEFFQAWRDEGTGKRKMLFALTMVCCGRNRASSKEATNRLPVMAWS